MTRSPTNDRDLDAEFDAFRQERNLRRQQRSQPLRGLGGEADVLREIEEQEMEEARERQLSTDMLDFFTAAKRKAAGIVQHVTEIAEEEASGRIGREVEEFLTTLLERATAFMQSSSMQRGGGNIATKTVEPDMHNLVGRLLDEFRSEGTAQLEDKHIGQNPFETDVEAVAAERRPVDVDEDHEDSAPLAPSPQVVDPLVEAIGSEPEDQPVPAVAPAPVSAPRPRPREPQPREPRPSIENHLVAEVLGGEQQSDAAIDVHPLISWLGSDVEKVGAVLRVLVQHDLIGRDEARSVYQALLES